MSDYRVIEAVKKYKLDDLERKAYYLMLIWTEKCAKAFPNYSYSRIKSGDPRKSLTFKFCYKLARETESILLESEYPFYVRAQLTVLKHITSGDTYIDPACLVGEKAWKRWKLWKNRYDKISKQAKVVESTVTVDHLKIINDLEKTKEFIIKTYGANPTIEKFKESYINKNIFRWINFGKLSPYYIVLSPHVSNIFSEDDFKKLNFDKLYYQNLISEKIKTKFREMFNYEFGNTSS